MGNSVEIGSWNKKIEINQTSNGSNGSNEVEIKNKNQDINIVQGSDTTEKSNTLENIIYVTVSILAALIANYLIGVMNLEFNGYGMVVQGSGSFAVFIFTLLMLKHMRK